METPSPMVGSTAAIRRAARRSWLVAAWRAREARAQLQRDTRAMRCLRARNAVVRAGGTAADWQ